MQGWSHIIPTQRKIEYLNALLKVRFDTLDFGSFVSAKAIPQMADTREVINGLDLNNTQTKLLAIIANQRGAEEAVKHNAIHYLGFPFSISETFQLRNTNSTINDSISTVNAILELCDRNNKELVVYLSMGFGNPYGDPYDESVVIHWTEWMVKAGIKTISIADTVGLAEPSLISSVLKSVIPAFPGVEIGVHLHSSQDNRKQKLEAAFEAGCARFDGAIKGIGGCPMAGDKLIGNMDTEFMVNYFKDAGIGLDLDSKQLEACSLLASKVFV